MLLGRALLGSHFKIQSKAEQPREPLFSLEKPQWVWIYLTYLSRRGGLRRPVIQQMSVYRGSSFEKTLVYFRKNCNLTFSMNSILKMIRSCNIVHSLAGMLKPILHILFCKKYVCFKYNQTTKHWSNTLQKSTLSGKCCEREENWFITYSFWQLLSSSVSSPYAAQEKPQNQCLMKIYV